MTNTELDNIESLINSATQQPWVTDLKDNKWIICCGDPNNYHTIAQINSTTGMNAENNAKFIAASRQIISQLLNEIKKLKNR